MLNKPPMLTTLEVAEVYRKHPVTVRIALQAGMLHGRQSVAGGRWLVEDGCADSWSRGVLCQHLESVPAPPIKLRRASA